MGMDLLTATERDYMNYFKELESMVFSYSSIARKISTLSTYLDYLVFAGQLKNNPITNIRKVTRLYRAVSLMPELDITVEDVNRVLVKGGRYISVIIETLVNTGIRVSELCNIKQSDVSLNGKYASIRIRGKGKKERTVWFEKDLYERVTKIFDHFSEYLFHSSSGKPLSRQNLYARIRNAFMHHAGKGKIGPHDLRHFFATHLIRDKKQDIKAVSNHLGHASTSTTLDMYVDSKLKPEDTKIV
jgi:site-specific recombinase XerD